MEKKTFIDWVIEFVNDPLFHQMSAEKKAETYARMNNRFDEKMTEAYYNGYCEGKRIGLKDGIDLATKNN
jgi:hypothetical protein